MVLVTKTKRPTSIHHKRRVGQHHKRGEHYLKPYWPYLPLALIVAVGLTFSSLWGKTDKSVLGYATNMSVSALLQGTNTQRQNNGLGSLAINDQLDQAAQAKANDMATRNYWSHNTPDGKTPWTFIISSGYQYQTAGENLAYGFDSSDATITAWMNSPEHRANILDTSYKDVGFGVADAANYQDGGPQTIIVAMYASPQPAVAASVQQSQPVASTPTPSTPVAPTPAAAVPTSPPAEVNATAPAASVGSVKPVSTERVVKSKNVARVQLLAGNNAPWAMFGVSVFACLCLVLFVLRHGLFWHRVLVKGEVFVVKHRVLDVALVGGGVIGFVLTRSAGVIH